MNPSLLSKFGDTQQRMEKAISALQAGQGILVVDDEGRENEGDLIFSAQNLTAPQMAMMMRECSGIICLCLPPDKIKALELSPMVAHNTSKNQTAFTISIEAKEGVTTGVSAKDRVTTIKAAAAPHAKPEDLCHPGHVFPLCAQQDGVFSRRGHTEATVDMMKLAGLEPAGVLCELTNPDGTMARLPEVITFANQHEMVVISVEDIVAYRNTLTKAA